MAINTGHHIIKKQLVKLGVQIKQQLGDISFWVRIWHVPRDFILVLENLPFDMIKLGFAPLLDVLCRCFRVLGWEAEGRFSAE
jgi:hypothetical protein